MDQKNSEGFQQNRQDPSESNLENTEELKNQQDTQGTSVLGRKDSQISEYNSQYDNYSARNFASSSAFTSTQNPTSTQSAQELKNQILQQQMMKKQAQQQQVIQPVDRPIPSTVKNKNQFICAGYGAYGVVCAAHDKQANINVAIKKIPKAFEDLVDAKRVLREIKILKFFEHENIVQLLDIQRPPSETGYNDVYIITELMEADMHKLIYSKQRLTDRHYQYFMYQLLRGVIFLHSANIMHRDLKPSNILVNMNCDLKICDFGLARGFGGVEQVVEKTIYVVTRWYRAPEVMLNQQYYTETLDVWSIGCIFAELMMKQVLFQGQHNMKQLDKIVEVLGYPSDEDLAFVNNEHSLNYIKRLPKKSPIKWEEKIPGASPAALDLLARMLSFNPDRRITLAEAIKHPYFETFLHLGAPQISETKFDWTWDNFELNKELLQKLIYMESLYYHPEEDGPNQLSTSSIGISTALPTKIIEDQEPYISKHSTDVTLDQEQLLEQSSLVKRKLREDESNTVAVASNPDEENALKRVKLQ